MTYEQSAMVTRYMALVVSYHQSSDQFSLHGALSLYRYASVCARLRLPGWHDVVVAMERIAPIQPPGSDSEPAVDPRQPADVGNFEVSED